MVKNKKNNEKITQGRWWKIKNNITKTISAKYDRIHDWKMDPKGYFLIKIDKECNLIRVGYCIFIKLGQDPIHDMIAEVTGKTAIEIVNTLIKEGYISTLQHSADMGIKLHKAQLALKYNLEYIQDKEIVIQFCYT